MDNKFQFTDPSFPLVSPITTPDLSNLTFSPRRVSVVEDEKSFKQLIILGNGFDLACGLKSTYKDFFNHILEKEESGGHYWYYIFRSLSIKNKINNGWTDIERQILTELKNIESLYDRDILKEGEYNDLDDIVQNDGFISKSREQKKDDSLYLTIRAAYFTIKSYYDLTPSKREFQSHLMDKMLVLENHFFNYLNEQIRVEYSHINNFFSDSKDTNQNNYYIKSAIIVYFLLISQTPKLSLGTLLSKLEKIEKHDSFDSFFVEFESIKNLFFDDDIEIIESNILSFNYTEPFKNLNIRNIHGALSDRNIIFGIDYDKLKINFKEPPIEFSKSYRILENGKTTSIKISSDIDIIKFYGHGLGEADYSYFQAIFDSVDLYHSNTQIIFYWSEYEGVEKTKIRVEQVKKVTNLIEEYGTTFTNEDHGRNLLTKLQLENRLQIEEIPINQLFKYLK